ncbi:GDSL-type esterase/lipase family protein [Ruminococcaceae bacterium OttesenSCG-928-O06]|nr:GDSL-type esterase/lipase family protein [Ruminococcaceae bacterium OttesenSCG-928-O06]
MSNDRDNRGHADYGAQNNDGRQAYRRKRQQRRRKKNVQRGLVLLVAAAVLVGLAFVISRIVGGREGDTVSSSAPPVSSQSQPPSSQSQPDTPTSTTPVVDNTAWNFIGPVQQDAEAMLVVTPDRRMIALPENGRIDMQYFDNVVFVGDSITQGLEMYSAGIPNAKYCAYLGVSPKGLYDGSMQKRRDGVTEVPLEALVAHQPDNVYVLLGTNAMVGMGDEALLTYYSEMLDAFKEALHPEVCIYVQSITPVVQGRDARFDMDRIRALNDQLAKMAFEKGLYFVDLNEALAGDDGWMRSDYGAGDGYHMTPAGYAAWVEYLVTHTAYNRRHAHLYLEGSNYYQQLPPEI